ncbi:hypothetical protein TNCV_3173211 [Trichonephila clavipes]|nr:hypothetical protein TNCV_3173211 [Trichonephila clavipes]
MTLKIQGDLLSDRQTSRVCGGYRIDSELHRNVGSYSAKKHKKKQKQQHIYGTENILLRGCTTTGVRNYDIRSHLAGLTSALHVIPYVLEDSWQVPHPPGSYRSELIAIKMGLQFACETKVRFQDIRQDSRASLQHLSNWTSIGDQTRLDILHLLANDPPLRLNSIILEELLVIFGTSEVIQGVHSAYTKKIPDCLLALCERSHKKSHFLSGSEDISGVPLVLFRAGLGTGLYCAVHCHSSPKDSSRHFIPTHRRRKRDMQIRGMIIYIGALAFTKKF